MKIPEICLKIGKCSICSRTSVFWYVIKNRNNYREGFVCVGCARNSRQRALVSVLKKVKPDYLNLKIHESSPSRNWFYIGRDSYANAFYYSCSYYYPDKVSGDRITDLYKRNRMNTKTEVTNQNIENMTFDDSSFDIFITQDVFEHINDIQKALLDIKRVLKPGGIHILTIPKSNFYHSFRRIELDENGKIAKYIQPEEYHIDPTNSDGCLVTMSWGIDSLEILEKMTGMKCTSYYFYENPDYIKSELLDSVNRINWLTNVGRGREIPGDVEVFVMQK